MVNLFNDICHKYTSFLTDHGCGVEILKPFDFKVAALPKGVSLGQIILDGVLALYLLKKAIAILPHGNFPCIGPHQGRVFLNLLTSLKPRAN